MQRVVVLFIVCFAYSQAVDDPNNVIIHTQDIEHFWKEIDRTEGQLTTEGIQQNIFNIGSVGLQDFIKLRIKNANEFLNTYKYHKAYYHQMRQTLDDLPQLKLKIRSHLYALKYLYPDANFKPIYLLIGRMNSGGTISDAGLLIGTELFSLSDEKSTSTFDPWLRLVVKPSEYLPQIITHEYIHTLQNHKDQNRTVLWRSINEGSADFISELISGDHINRHLHHFGNSIEEKIWMAFKKEMHGKDYSNWLYNGSNAKEWPADLGYYVGYKIVESYYHHSTDKKAAIRDILNISDMQIFLEKSNYEDKFNETDFSQQ